MTGKVSEGISPARRAINAIREGDFPSLESLLDRDLVLTFNGKEIERSAERAIDWLKQLIESRELAADTLWIAEPQPMPDGLDLFEVHDTSGKVGSMRSDQVTVKQIDLDLPGTPNRIWQFSEG